MEFKLLIFLGFVARSPFEALPGCGLQPSGIEHLRFAGAGAVLTFLGMTASNLLE
jgi:hypothetical protein